VADGTFNLLGTQRLHGELADKADIARVDGSNHYPLAVQTRLVHKCNKEALADALSPVAGCNVDGVFDRESVARPFRGITEVAI
jgi:hypothetical protein